MPTITLGVQTGSTSNTNSYTSGSFTPAAGDLLYAIVHATGTVVGSAPGTMTDSQGLTFTRMANAAWGGGGNGMYLFRANALAAASSMTVTFDCTGDNATGANITVIRVAGSGLIERQYNGDGGGTSVAPAITLGQAINTDSACFAVLGSLTNPPALTPPDSWAADSEVGYSTPSCGQEFTSRNSGETNTTITWGSVSATTWAGFLVEMAPVQATLDKPVPLSLTTAGAVQVTGALSLALALSLTSAGSVQVTADFNTALGGGAFIFASAGSVQVTASHDKAVPFGFSSDGSATGQINAAFNKAVPFTLSSYVQVNKGAATCTPEFRVTTTTFSSNTGADYSDTLPSDLWPGDRVLICIQCASTATPSQTVGPSFTQRTTFGQVGIGTSFWEYTAGASSNGDESDDAGDAITFTLGASNPWAVMMIVVQNGHETAAFYHVETQTMAGAGSTAIVAAGGIPVVPNAMQLTLVGYGTDSNAVTNSFPTTAAIDGGGTDALVAQANTSSASAVRNRGIALYKASSAPSVGTTVPSRTVTLVTGANTCVINALTLTLIPSTGGAGARFWNVPSMITMSDSVVNRMDVLMPDDANAGNPFPWLMHMHGGGAGDKNFTSTTAPLILKLLEAGRAIVSTNFRQPSHDASYTGLITAVDIHGTVRCLRGSLAALYGLNPSRVVGEGVSAGASALNGIFPSSGKSYARDTAQGHASESEDFDAVAIFFGDFNFAAVDPNFTALGITRSPQLPACNTSSPEAAGIVGTGALPYALCVAPRFDATAYPMTGSPTQDATENTYNKACPAYHLDGRAGYSSPPHLLVAHGTDDTQIPWYQSYNAQTNATELAMPPGLVQVARANGVMTWWENNVGAPHALNQPEWFPSTEPGATNGVQMDRIFDWLVMETGGPVIATILDTAVPFSLTATASVQVAAAFNKALPLTLSSATSVQVTAAFSQAVPFTLASDSSVQVTTALDRAVPFSLTSAVSVQVSAAFDQLLPLALSAAASAQATASLEQLVPLTFASTVSVQVTAVLTQSVPFTLEAFASPGTASQFDEDLPLSLTATASVQVTAAFDQAVPLAFSSDGEIVAIHIAFDRPLPLIFESVGTVARARLKFTDISHPLGRHTMKQIDLSRDYTFQVDVTQPAAATGDYEAASGITGWTAHIALSAGGATVHADLSKDLVERSGTPGRYYCQFDQLDLTMHLSLYAGRYAWIVLTKAGDLANKNFKRILVAHVDGDDQ